MEKITLINPWTHQPTTQEMTLDEIFEWGRKNVHPMNRPEWLKAARIAYQKQDGATLGMMIIGS